MSTPPVRDRAGRARHPILRLEVVGADGMRTFSYRVFCRRRHAAVDVGTCCACPSCDGITQEPVPSVECHDADASDPVEIGDLLRGGTSVIAQSATLADAIRLLSAEDRRSLAVVDDQHVVGVVYELAVQHQLPHQSIAVVMSSPLVLPQRLSPEAALRVLAAAHLREAVVVDDDGRPLGVFRDVDGLHAVGMAHASLRRQE